MRTANRRLSFEITMANGVSLVIRAACASALTSALAVIAVIVYRVQDLISPKLADIQMQTAEGILLVTFLFLLFRRSTPRWTVIFAIGVLLWFAIDWLIFGLMINGCPQDCAFSDFPQQHDTIMFFSIMAALYAADWVILRAGDEFVSAGT